MVLRNFLDEKVFFLQVAVVLTYFQSEKSQNKLDLMQNFLLNRFTKLVKINCWGAKQKSHATVILQSHFAWICTEASVYILSSVSTSKLLRKAITLYGHKLCTSPSRHISVLVRSCIHSVFALNWKEKISISVQLHIQIHRWRIVNQ